MFSEIMPNLEEFVVERNSDEDNEIVQDECTLDHLAGEEIGHAPFPAALYDTVNAVEVLAN